MWNGTGPTGRRPDNVPAGSSRLQRLSAACLVHVHARSGYRHARIVRKVRSRRRLVVLPVQHRPAEPRVVHLAVLLVRIQHAGSRDLSRYVVQLRPFAREELKGTNISFKLSPFYRSTRNQVQYQAIDALGGTLAGLNVGTQHSYGVEFSLQGGDVRSDGFSYILSYTYTNNQVHFSPINGQSVIDNINNAIEQYNSYTHACAGVNAGLAQLGGLRVRTDAETPRPCFRTSTQTRTRIAQDSEPVLQLAVATAARHQRLVLAVRHDPGAVQLRQRLRDAQRRLADSELQAQEVLRSRRRCTTSTARTTASPLSYPGIRPAVLLEAAGRRRRRRPAISCNNPNNFTPIRRSSFPIRTPATVR